MRDIIYDVAVSVDGFIAASDGDVSAFPHDGDHVTEYFERLSDYSTVIMGRATYEFGYDYGLLPGARAYPHMDHHIFTRSGRVPADKDVSVVTQEWTQVLARLRSIDGGPIYLCGGGLFAAFVASAGHLTDLVLKRTPLILGQGVPLFSGLNTPLGLSLVRSKSYASGVRLEHYKVTGIA